MIREQCKWISIKSRTIHPANLHENGETEWSLVQSSLKWGEMCSRNSADISRKEYKSACDTNTVQRVIQTLLILLAEGDLIR